MTSKSKKSKRKNNDLTEESLMAAMAEMRKEGVTVPITDKPPPKLTSDLLKGVRDAAMRASSDTAHNIAELESWRSEIDATIAFLRAHQRR